VHTDFFAVRAEKISSSAFQNWETEKNAEEQATKVFMKIIHDGKCPWIIPKNRDSDCQVRGSVLWHDNSPVVTGISSDHLSNSEEKSRMN